MIAFLAESLRAAHTDLGHDYVIVATKDERSGTVRRQDGSEVPFVIATREDHLRGRDLEAWFRLEHVLHLSPALVALAGARLRLPAQAPPRRRDHELGRRCTAIADQVEPRYRDRKRSYSCTGTVARRWQAAWEGACAALGGDPLDWRG